jgi:NADH-quinone oxidoreductase subunit M
MSDTLLLTLLWALPLAGSLLVLALPGGDGRAARWAALAVSVGTLVLAVVAVAQYVRMGQADPSTWTLAARAPGNTLTVGANDIARIEVPGDLVTRAPWIPAFNIEYFLGVDGIGLSLALLTALTSVLACLASWPIEKWTKGYYSLFLLLLASMMGVFLALDLFLFYVFFEVMLLPMYFLIALWGGERREYAALKFLLYTLLGSVFILLAILVLYFWAPEGAEPLYSFDMIRLAAEAGRFPLWVQRWVFGLFLVGFLVKLPSFPFHTWLPDAHVEAPTPISMILAGVLLKVGGYGMIRMAWPLAPAGASDLGWYVAVLGAFSIIYGALAALAQTDFKRLVAYSSVSHMGYVTLGLAAMNLVDPRAYAYGVNGAVYIMLAHGITSAAMFFLVGVIYDRAHTRDMNALGGLMNAMPVYGGVSFLIFFGAMGLPGLCGFVGEVFVVLAAFRYDVTLAVLAAVAVVLTAGYVLWTLQRVYLGRSDGRHAYPDLTGREKLIVAPLVVLTVVLGILPQLVLGWVGPSADEVARQVVGAKADEGTNGNVAVRGR